ncbi:MAG: Mur ligase family protein, partial [Phycisphaerae bacterium]
MAKTVKSVSKRTAKKSPKTARVSSKKAFRTYDDAMKYLYAQTDYEKEKRVRYNNTTFNLSRMEKLLRLLGNPHKKLKTVHIAGTKGKGSTATMLAKMLESNNYRVGLYTSPHVMDLHERIVIDSKMITRSHMLKLMNRIYSPVEKLSKTESPSFFEIMTALAFMHFADEKVDIAVVETGLGGRLDSTNVILPQVVGITNLSIDHQGQLGNNLALIAAEKAGIFKRGVPIITVEQEASA